MLSPRPTPLRVAILGTDAVLAAQPADPMQLARACQLAGYDFVAPITWGEEIVATHIAQRATVAGPTSTVMSSCPFVAEQLRMMAQPVPAIKTVAPVVACARYLRAAFEPKSIHVTYIGACPGASSAEIDERLLPDVLFGQFVGAGIDLITQPRHFDAQVPPERARYASLPGGAPDPRWLMARSGARMLEAARVTVDAVARANAGCSVVIDLANASRCACARDRIAAARAEPPRAVAPVVLSLAIDMMDELPVAPVERAIRQPAGIEGPRFPRGPRPLPLEGERDRRATFAEYGLSASDAEPPESLTPAFSDVVEPWSN